MVSSIIREVVTTPYGGYEGFLDQKTILGFRNTFSLPSNPSNAPEISITLLKDLSSFLYFVIPTLYLLIIINLKEIY
jgi:hypothetical protein